MKIITLLALVLGYAPSFIAAMEQQPTWKPTKSNPLFIVIPTTNYKDSDDDESCLSTERLSRTSGSPLRLTKSGSPLPRISTRKALVSPRIEQEMQENIGLSPKDKKLTPRSKLLYIDTIDEYFGSGFFDDELAYSISPDSNNWPNGTIQEDKKNKDSKSLSQSDSSLEWIAQVNLKRQAARLPSSTSPETIAKEAVSETICLRTLPEKPRVQVKGSFSLANLCDTDDSIRTKRIFPGFFTGVKTPHEKTTHPNMLLQIGIINNDLALVNSWLAHAVKPTATLRKNVLEAAKKVVRKIKDTKNFDKEIAALITAKNKFVTEIHLFARPHAPRELLKILVGSSKIIEEKNLHIHPAADRIIGLTYIFLEAHRHKAKSSGQEKAYLDTFAKINTALWDAYEIEMKFYNDLEDLCNDIPPVKEVSNFNSILKEIFEFNKPSKKPVYLK